MHTINHVINGQLVTGDGSSMEVYNPATGKVITCFNESSPEQVRSATAAAKASFESGVWRNTPVRDKQTTLRNIATEIRKHSQQLVELQVLETGMTIGSVPLHIESAARWFEFYADYLTSQKGEFYQQLGAANTIVTREPIGVCALFSPWNVPINLTAIKIAPALAAGNSIVVKPSEETPLCTQLLMKIIAKAGLPDGVVNSVNGRGQSCGAALASSPDIDMISFTGGHIGGQAVANQAMQRNLPCVMELGGKSATLVFADANLDEAVDGAFMAIYANNGEACLAGSRILLQDSIANEFIAKFSAKAASMRIGDPMSPDTQMGPMINAGHQQRVLGFYEQAQADGDEVLFGLDAELPVEGYFVAPGAIRVASTDSRIWNEEVFGPIAAITTFSDEAEAITLANHSNYGLSGYVWTDNLDKAMRVSKAMRTGTVVINSSFMREQNAPFGGYKQSGIGREGGDYSWYNFTEPKAVLIKQR